MSNPLLGEKLIQSIEYLISTVEKNIFNGKKTAQYVVYIWCVFNCEQRK